MNFRYWQKERNQVNWVKDKIIQFPRNDKETERNLKLINMAVSTVAAIFIVLLYCMIFFFSDQNGETSGSLSHKVTEAIVVEIEEITQRNWTDELRVSIISYWENPVRKMAHFSEYAGLGILVFILFIPWVTADGWKRKKLKWNLIVVIWVFISASLDEWHQTFVSDRCGNFWDVLLDTSGGFFGLCMCLLAVSIIKWITLLKEKKDAV